MAQSEIEAVRALLSSKPRPIGWPERRQRLDDVGSVWPVAHDVELAAVDVNGMAGEYSIVPGSDPSRILMFFHGGGYCSGSIRSHRRMVSEAGRAAEMRTLSVAYRLAPEHPVPAAYDDALTAWGFLQNQGISAARITIGGDSAGAGRAGAFVNRVTAPDWGRAACGDAADVQGALEVWPHLFHAWHLWNAHLEPGRRALARAGAFIRRHL